MSDDEATCPACGNPLARYGCKDVEQVGAFCRGPTPPRKTAERWETATLQGKGLCGLITGEKPHERACILPAGHDDGVHGGAKPKMMVTSRRCDFCMPGSRCLVHRDRREDQPWEGWDAAEVAKEVVPWPSAQEPIEEEDKTMGLNDNGDHKCIVHGCANRTTQGRFVGSLCSPCYDSLSSGKLGPGETFLHELKAERDRVVELLKTVIGQRNKALNTSDDVVQDLYVEGIREGYRRASALVGSLNALPEGQMAAHDRTLKTAVAYAATGPVPVDWTVLNRIRDKHRVRPKTPEPGAPGIAARPEKLPLKPARDVWTPTCNASMMQGSNAGKPNAPRAYCTLPPGHEGYGELHRYGEEMVHTCVAFGTPDEGCPVCWKRYGRTRSTT